MKDSTENTEPNNEKSNNYDRLDPINLRLDQSLLSTPAAKKLLTTVPVRKPHRQDFIRVHPGPEYRMDAAVVEMHDEREVYITTNQVTPELSSEEYHFATLFLCINRQKVVSLWPVRLPTEGRQQTWHASAREAAERAMHSWIRLSADMSLGAYAIYESIGDFGEPIWPQASLCRRSSRSRSGIG